MTAHSGLQRLTFLPLCEVAAFVPLPRKRQMRASGIGTNVTTHTNAKFHTGNSRPFADEIIVTATIAAITRLPATNR